MRYRHLISLVALAAAVTFVGPISGFSPLMAGKVLADKGSGSDGKSESSNSGKGSENSGHGNANDSDDGALDGVDDDSAVDQDDNCAGLNCPVDDDGRPNQGSGDAPGTETPGDDDGTPDQGSGDN
jgi:hypothetical protein